MNFMRFNLSQLASPMWYRGDLGTWDPLLRIWWDDFVPWSET